MADYTGGLFVEISAPEGELLAKKTFNPRLGIVGGISILGTTGIVEPMSEQALLDTIQVELRQRRTNGEDTVLLTPGNYGADYIRSCIGLNPGRAVLVSNFIGESLDMAKALGFSGALLIGHMGKLVKLAGGMLNTHSKYGDCRMEIIAAYAGAEGLSAEEISQLLTCAACDDAVRILRENGCCDRVLRRIMERIAVNMDHRTAGEMQTGAIMFSKEYGLLGETENARALLTQIWEG